MIKPFVKKTGNLDQEFFVVKFYDEEGEEHYCETFTEGKRQNSWDTFEEANTVKNQIEKIQQERGF